MIDSFIFHVLLFVVIVLKYTNPFWTRRSFEFRANCLYFSSVNIFQIYFHWYLHFRVGHKDIRERILHRAVHLLERSLELAGLQRHCHGVSSKIYLIYTLHHIHPFTGSTLNKCCLSVFFSVAKATEVSHSSWLVIWNSTNDKVVVGVRDLCDMTVCPWCWGQIRQVTSWSANAALSQTNRPDGTFALFENRKIKSFLVDVVTLSCRGEFMVLPANSLAVMSTPEEAFQMSLMLRFTPLLQY